MDASQSRTPRPGVERHGSALLHVHVQALFCALLALSFVSATPVRAQTPAQPPGAAAFADILSASSWLLVSGRDPRYPAVIGSNAWIGNPASGTAAAIDRSPPEAFSRNVIVTRQPGLAPVNADPALAVNPLDADHLILAVNALDLPSVATYSSFDGGATWQGPNQAPYFPGDTGAAGPPAAAFGGDGTAYLVAQSVSLARQGASDGSLVIERSRIALSTSDDGGLTWGDPVSVAVAASDTTTTTDAAGLRRTDVVTSFLDSPSLVVISDPGRPEREVLSVAYTELDSRASLGEAEGAAGVPPPITETTIRFVQSTDRGQTWSSPQALSPTAVRTAAVQPSVSAGPDAVAPADLPGSLEAVPTPASPLPTSQSGQVVQGAQLAALPDGTLLAAYLDSTDDGPHQGLARIMISTAADGGAFTEPVQAGLFREVLARPRRSFVQWWGTSFPRLAVGASGEIYIAVTARPGERPADDGDVLLLRSRDGGTTWDAAVPIAAGATEAAQFFPALAIAADDSLLAVWADARDDPNGVGYAVRASVSRDSGETWQSLAPEDASATDDPVSDVVSNSLAGSPGGRYLGGRIAMAATADDVYVAWPDTRMATPGAPNLQIAFARQRPIEGPAPSD